MVLITLKWSELQVSRAELKILEAQKAALEETLYIKQTMAIKALEEEQRQVNQKLEEWDDIDKRWLVWIEENWTLVKNINPHD